MAYKKREDYNEWHRRRRAANIAKGLRWDGKPRRRPYFKRRPPRRGNWGE